MGRREGRRRDLEAMTSRTQASSTKSARMEALAVSMAKLASSKVSPAREGGKKRREGRKEGGREGGREGSE